MTIATASAGPVAANASTLSPRAFIATRACVENGPSPNGAWKPARASRTWPLTPAAERIATAAAPAGDGA